MTTLREAAQQALEALNLHAEQYPHMVKGYTLDAENALRAALEFDTTTQSAGSPQTTSNPVAIFDEALGHPVLLSHAPMLADEQPLYTHPPREWQGLTDAEISGIVRSAVRGTLLNRDGGTSLRIARAIEQALKEKNT